MGNVIERSTVTRDWITTVEALLAKATATIVRGIHSALRRTANDSADTSDDAAPGGDPQRDQRIVLPTRREVNEAQVPRLVHVRIAVLIVMMLMLVALAVQAFQQFLAGELLPVSLGIVAIIIILILANSTYNSLLSRLIKDPPQFVKAIVLWARLPNVGMFYLSVCTTPLSLFVLLIVLPTVLWTVLTHFSLGSPAQESGFYYMAFVTIVVLIRFLPGKVTEHLSRLSYYMVSVWYKLYVRLYARFASQAVRKLKIPNADVFMLDMADLIAGYTPRYWDPPPFSTPRVASPTAAA
jgi:hypothetical protein